MELNDSSLRLNRNDFILRKVHVTKGSLHFGMHLSENGIYPLFADLIGILRLFNDRPQIEYISLY